MISLFVSVIGLCAIWAVWEFGIKLLVLDTFRDRLFEIRDELFELGVRGDVRFDDEAYRMVETLINGLIRYAHRLSFAGFLLAIREDRKSNRDKDEANFGNQLALKLERLDPEIRSKILALLPKINRLVMLYVAATSGIFKVLFLAYLVAKIFKPDQAHERKTHTVYVFEREAYRAATRSNNRAVV